MVCDTPIGGVRAHSGSIPAGAPEADGTQAWTSATMVTVEAKAGGPTGFGCVAGDAALPVAGRLAAVLHGRGVAGDVRCCAQHGALRHRGDGDFRGEPCAAVSEGGAVRVRPEAVRWNKGPPSLGITEHWNYENRKDCFGGNMHTSQEPILVEWAPVQTGTRAVGSRACRQDN